MDEEYSHCKHILLTRIKVDQLPILEHSSIHSEEQNQQDLCRESGIGEIQSGEGKDGQVTISLFSEWRLAEVPLHRTVALYRTWPFKRFDIHTLKHFGNKAMNGMLPSLQRGRAIFSRSLKFRICENAKREHICSHEAQAGSRMASMDTTTTSDRCLLSMTITHLSLCSHVCSTCSDQG